MNINRRQFVETLTVVSFTPLVISACGPVIQPETSGSFKHLFERYDPYEIDDGGWIPVQSGSFPPRRTFVSGSCTFLGDYIDETSDVR